MKWSFKVRIVFCICILAVSCFSGCSSSGGDDANSIPVLITPDKEHLTTVTVKKGSIDMSSEIRGAIIPTNVADACFKYRSGYLAKVNVKLGDTVKKGEVIASLDDTETRYAVKQQEVKLQLAQLTYDEALKSNSSDYETKKAELMLESEKLEMEKLQNDLNNCVLTAEISGKIVQLADVRPMQYITGDIAIATIADPSSYMVQCNSDDVNFTIGLQVTLKKPGSGIAYKGEIVSNTAITNKASREGVIVAKFLDSPGDIQLSDTISVSCTLPQRDNIIAIPRKAILYGEGDHPYVRIVQGDNILERYINTGDFNSDLVEVTNGLSEGEVVVIN